MNAHPPIPPRRARRGCLGRLALVLVLAVVAMIGAEHIFAPWIFTAGGRNRLLPIWMGQGEVQTPAGTYQIQISFSPWHRRSGQLPGISVTGSAHVCSPKGESYALSLSGGSNMRAGNSTDGQKLDLRAWHVPPWHDFTGAPRLPSLRFVGQWAGADLVMDDGGSIAWAFLPDGSLNTRRPDGWNHEKTAPLRPITFKEVSYRPWWPACPARG